MYQTPGITKKQTRLLGLCAAVALLAVGATAATGRAAPTPYYQVQLEAAGRMQACMDVVKGYKAERDIPLSPEDTHQTGMIGEEFNLLTTTLGEIGAKRTTANSDMAALAVKLLRPAGGYGRRRVFRLFPCHEPGGAYRLRRHGCPGGVYRFHGFLRLWGQ